MFSRTDRSALSTWWWTVDKPLLTALVALMFGGLVLSLAGSPPVADKLGLEPFHFVKRHAFFLVIALSALIGTSLLDVRTIRRLAIAVFVVGVFLMVVTLFAGFEIKGARRWLNVGVFALQPSEFVKPAFAVIIAWLFAEADRR
ncbi:MAG: FtsW/RodA/SpoVE family cell cycle protein, partial [Rhodobiaceae bacterium]|nr:FtsW/RodA/SpoVE family cell cycle protein [Rhodobiaceae bacterium]